MISGRAQWYIDWLVFLGMTVACAYGIAMWMIIEFKPEAHNYRSTCLAAGRGIGILAAWAFLALIRCDWSKQ